MHYALNVNTQYENKQGCFRNCQLEEEIRKTPLLFTLENILNVVNAISKEEYTSIVFIN